MKRTAGFFLVLVSAGCTALDKGPKGEIIPEEARAMTEDLNG